MSHKVYKKNNLNINYTKNEVLRSINLMSGSGL